MKKYNLGFFLMAFVMLLTVVGCQKDTVSIKARIAVCSNNDKTYMGGPNDRTPMWNSSDEVWINGTPYQIQGSGNSSHFEGVTSSRDYRAIYPSSIVTGNNDINSSNIEISIPEVQNYVTVAGHQVVEAPMGAQVGGSSNNPHLCFTNMGGILAIQLINNTTQARSQALSIDEIIITSADHNMALWGNGIVERINDENRRYVINETLTGEDDPHCSVSLTGIADVTLSAATPTVLYIYVPAATGDVLNRFKIEVKAHSSAGTFTYTREQTQAGQGNVGLNCMAYIPFDLASAAEDFVANAIPEGAIDALFTVADGVQVYFSQGNLRYDVANETFRIPENQYDIVGNVYRNSTIEEIELLGWGTSGYQSGQFTPGSTTKRYAGPTDFATTSDFQYGPVGTINLSSLDGSPFDWGSAIESECEWRTLTQDEWVNLFERYDDCWRRAEVIDEVSEVHTRGIVVFPDNFHSQSDVFIDDHTNHDDAWECYKGTLDRYHIVFLPYAGSRSNTTYTDGWAYWTATTTGNLSARYMYLTTTPAKSSKSRNNGCAVRLVTNVQ